MNATAKIRNPINSNFSLKASFVGDGAEHPAPFPPSNIPHIHSFLLLLLVGSHDHHLFFAAPPNNHFIIIIIHIHIHTVASPLIPPLNPKESVNK
jgi:hypothetical protein